MRAKVVMAVCVVTATVAFRALPDEIAIKVKADPSNPDKTVKTDSPSQDKIVVKNVLITKTASFYYIQFPDEGRTVSIPVGEVDPATVKITKDPFYRNPLRETYNKNRAKRAAGEMKDVDPAFKAGKGDKLETAEAGGGSGKKAGAGGGGGGGAKGGFGVPRTAIETSLKNFGFQFQPGPGDQSSVANRPGNSLELLGPPDNLTGIVAKGNGPAAQVDGNISQLKLFLTQLKPEAVSAFDQAMNDAKSKGSGSGSAGGVNISINRKVDGANANIEARITAG